MGSSKTPTQIREPSLENFFPIHESKTIIPHGISVAELNLVLLGRIDKYNWGVFPIYDNSYTLFITTHIIVRSIPTKSG